MGRIRTRVFLTIEFAFPLLQIFDLISVALPQSSLGKALHNCLGLLALEVSQLVQVCLALLEQEKRLYERICFIRM